MLSPGPGHERVATVRPEGPAENSGGWSESAAGGRSGTPGRRGTAQGPQGAGNPERAVARNFPPSRRG